MKKLLLNITFVALSLGSHGHAMQPKSEQSLTLSERKTLIEKFKQSEHDRDISKRYNSLPSEHTWLDDIDYGDKEERPSAPTPSHKQKITTIPSESKSNPTACVAASNTSQQEQQQPSRLKPALMVGLSATATLALAGILASHASLSDILSRAAAEQASDDCWVNCADEHARVNNLYLAHRYLIGALTAGLVTGGLMYADVKSKIGALYKKIKGADQKQVQQQAEEAHQKAFDALEDNLNKLYSSILDTEEQLMEKTIAQAWTFRHATDALYRAMHPNALNDGIAAAEEFIKKHFDKKIESLKKPQAQHGQFLYGMFMNKVTEIPKNITQTCEGLRKLASRSNARAPEIQVAKGNYENALKLFHPVAVPKECPIEIEISLNQLKANKPDCYTKIITLEKKETEDLSQASYDCTQPQEKKYPPVRAFLPDTVIRELAKAQNATNESVRVCYISLATIEARYYLSKTTSETTKQLTGDEFYQNIYNILTQCMLRSVNEAFPDLYASFERELLKRGK